ncbi:uncharacterized protein EDB93DRAFT_775632 [Suillus bovinus]|uniref:uncharacterized protein n=1 Tax=Suillus bovinus TaxID=48563 RepID=UPI001B86FED4|nr:uncharacterized protein EDB93DRAFT_775632 [Suillus bovinus]KAG2136581.1 hypothetical protein EDB93DRAFT_775632 [Suillus bovinus]
MNAHKAGSRAEPVSELHRVFDDTQPLAQTTSFFFPPGIPGSPLCFSRSWAVSLISLVLAPILPLFLALLHLSISCSFLRSRFRVSDKFLARRSRGSPDCCSKVILEPPSYPETGTCRPSLPTSFHRPQVRRLRPATKHPDDGSTVPVASEAGRSGVRTACWEQPMWGITRLHRTAGVPVAR